MGFFAPLAAGLGSLFTKSAVATGAKSLLGSVAGGLVNRAFDNRKQSDSYDFLAGKGLTPQEIAGSGAAGQGSTGVGNVLGNQAAELTRIQRQQAYDEKQRNLDRAVALRSQDTSLQAARTSAGAQMYGADVNARTAAGRLSLDRDTFDNVTLPDALRRSVTESPSWKRSQILASMGVDNILATEVANSFGVNPMDSSAVRSMSPDQFMEMVKMIKGMQSNVFTEGAGAAMTLGSGMSGLASGVRSLGGR